MSPKTTSPEVSMILSSVSQNLELMKQKQTRNRIPWTAEEEAIYLQLMAEHLQATFWGKIKDDGRLVGRGSTGIKAHLGSVVSCIHLIMSVRLMSR